MALSESYGNAYMNMPAKYTMYMFCQKGVEVPEWKKYTKRYQVK